MVLIVALVLCIIGLVKLSGLRKKYEKFMTGKNAASLEQEITGLFEENKILRATEEKNRKDIQTLNGKMRTAFRKIGLVKYDAFHQMGGQLSFCLVLLDEENNGFLLNSVHTSDSGYTYMKEIKNGQCAIELGEEEQQALTEAVGYCG